jgi:hypothetical protein
VTRPRATKNRSAYPFFLPFLFLSDGVGVGVGVGLFFFCNTVLRDDGVGVGAGLPFSRTEPEPTGFTGNLVFGVAVSSILTVVAETTAKCERTCADPLPLPLPGQSFGPPGPQSCEVVVSILVWPSGRKVVHTLTVFVHASPVEVHLLLVVVLHTGTAVAMPIPVARPRAAVIITKPNLLFIMTMSNTTPPTLGKREHTRSNN